MSGSNLLDNRLIPHHHLHDFPIHDVLDVSPVNGLELVSLSPQRLSVKGTSAPIRIAILSSVWQSGGPRPV